MMRSTRRNSGRLKPPLRRNSTVAVKAMVRVVGREVMAPVLETEGRIGDDAVVGKESSRLVHEARLGYHVTCLQPAGTQTMEQQVAFLAVEREIAEVSALFPHVLRRIDEHTSEARRRVADAHPLAGRVELPALLAGVMGEPVDQVLVGVAQNVIDKIQRYPISFVIKSDLEEDEIYKKLRIDAQSLYDIDAVVQIYVESIEEIINTPKLAVILNDQVQRGNVKEILDEIVTQSKLEFNLD